MTTSSNKPPSAMLLEARGLTKAFPGVVALDGVDFTLRAGEVHALLGENGAGKSTLIAILTGALAADDGSISIQGRPIAPRNPRNAQREGIAAVYQDVGLLPNLTIAENLFLGRQPTRFGFLRRREMHERARRLLAGYGLTVDPGQTLETCSTAVQQIVAIARAVDLSAKVLILDEPTASLDARETKMLFGAIRELASRGIGIVFITHFLDQVYAIADRVTVLRNGRRVAEREIAALPKLELVSFMLGKALAEETRYRRRDRALAGVPVVSFRNFGRRGFVGKINLDLHAGEVVGAAGLLGSGRTETAMLMFGAPKATSGDALVSGRRVRIGVPRDAIRLGFGLCPEDRKRDGVIGAHSVRENIALAAQARRGWLRRLSRRRQDAIAAEYLRTLDIRTPDAEKPIAQLSGGNQQKALLARWLATEPRLLILDEPTRGIDVGAHAEIMRLIGALRENGLALYVVSSELDEIVAYADRVVVMRDRQPAGVLSGDAVNEQAIITAIAGQEAA